MPGRAVAAGGAQSATFAKIPTGPAPRFLGVTHGYDPTITGDNKLRWFTPHEHIARTLGWVVVTDPKYGAKGNGTTNDTAAIQTALYEAQASNPVPGQHGAVCYVPQGTYLVSDQLVVPTQVRFVGASSIGTKIQAIDGQFPWADKALVRLGEPSVTSAIFSTTIEQMRIWCVKEREFTHLRLMNSALSKM